MQLFEKILDRPVNSLLIGCSLIIGVTVAFLLIGTMAGDVRRDLEVTLLVFGVLSILIVILRTENAIAITIAVLIIGTVVAGERFLLSVTALVGGTSDEGRKFVQDVYGSRQATNVKQFNENELARIIIEKINQKGTEDARTTQVVAGFIREARVLELAEDVRRRGAEVPLLRLFSGEDEWADFANSVRQVPAFRDDMLFLQSIGLVSIDRGEILSATLTESGRRVAAILDETPLERAAKRVLLVPDGEIEDIAIDKFVEIIPNKDPIISRFTSSSTNWFRFNIDKLQVYTIETFNDGPVDSFLDTVITLYDKNKKELASDDDGSSDLHARLSRALDVGEYYIRVETLDALPDTFRISIKSAQ